MGWLDKYDDEIIAQGGETIPLSREIPEITVYGKKKYLQELDKQQQKYLADMAKYKQDSAAYQSYQDSLNLYTDVLDMANSEQNTYWNTRKKEIIDNYKRTAKGETVEYWKKAKAESKDADKSWYDQMIKKSIDEQKYYSNPKNIDKAIQDETKKHYNAFNIGTAYQLKTATNKNSNRFDYPDDGYFYTNMIRANNSSDREYKDYLNYFIKDRESELATAIKSGKNQVSVSGMASTNIPGAKSEISNAKRLKKLLSSDIKPIGYTDSPESLRYPIYKKPVVEPPIATKPIRTNVKYDSTYENLQMRPLWATMAKQDTTSKIGTLNPLDPLYEKGFTYGEAQKFPEEIRKQYKLDYPIYESGGIIPKAQEGRKVKKSVIFAESPKIEGGQPQYEIYDYHSQLPPSLNNLREKYKDLRKRSDELYSTTASLRNYLINYLKGYTGKDVYSVNSDNTYSALDDDGYERVYSTEEFKDLPQLKKYNELEKEFYENYYQSLMALENEFRDHPDNTTSDRVSDVFQVEGNKLREWYKKKGEELSVIPIYGIQDTSKVNAALKDVDLQDVGIMGHSGEILGGIPLEWWNNKLKDAEYRNCILGSCLGDNLLPLLPDVKNIYHTTKNGWYGVNPSADSLENALFSTQEKTKIKPIKGRDYNISNKYKTGGNVSYTPEYIEQLKRFENRPDNLAYHQDNKGIPTIGWGHRITEEELKRKAIKMGKEWIPYEKFSGKEGRILADKLMEQDVSHHYARLERQVGKDTLATLPPEVHDVLLDITYNRGSLGDSLEYVKSGDIAGLRNYLAETSKGLKGGAKTRMEWRANRIPVKTLPPVEAPINYNIENQYVPEVLQSIAEQPSTQSIIPIQDNEGYRNQENYGKPVQITSNQSRTPISMEGVPFPILAMSDTGELKIMMPGEEHEFEGGSVTELPMAQQGNIIKSNQLRTFTKDSGWLNKYKEL